MRARSRLLLRKIMLWRKDRTLCQTVSKHFKRRSLILKRLKEREEEKEYRDYFRKQRSAKIDLPPYLTKNSWEHELNFKLWITKGARFNAARRCEEMDNYGMWANTILSSYLIIVGLIPYFPHPIFKTISPELLGFGTTSLSVLLLAQTLIVTSRHYQLQARSHHDCALKIGHLYDVLRQAKEIKDDRKKRAEISRVTKEYEALLPNYANHFPIDHDMFQTLKPTWFKLGCWKVFRIKARYYFHTRCIMDAVILLGVLLIILGVWRGSLINSSV
ncbi:SLATT domain-containing protein [Phragmitibacter flavus]|uniref:SLATT domain-containing protein n=1 Tax=Phragmitibacter flavus TaxID=2576071 RepID=A0A5R8K998_9BACT|nr:SLATT domain-containing protein [Phragmitibacter flavus]TLD68505.1 SLATT domain-containing protein [Phragmitibacter flavus]